ncbi:NAD(P)-binding protein [Nocardia sp. ET3-3]|uniref:NAD(P)-binding protein n=1 Tax=Nocardia terrae TaxID=2675851 RepID=A0A7K1V2H7_9NOCA|nr:NAD(P)/FAD-dependent oxidoreductase [Nocardia terrae]MVU80741.1 NAD(P)-binding protein [Nocardia terrae]
MASAPEHVDVLIVGAGLSGIGAACRLRRAYPSRKCVILEARESIGGTWDLFRYPGVRSDSDMHTLGYRFRPWAGKQAVADGDSILTYLRETAAEAGIDRDIRFGHRVVGADWSSGEQRWTVTVERGGTGEPATLTADFLFCCSGYYRYDRGYIPALPGRERFTGPVIHPQQWPQDLAVAGKRVVIIGSGATAVTLGPALAKLGARVCILQRSPSYILPEPTRDGLVELLRRVLPVRLGNAVIRAKKITAEMVIYQLSQRNPGRMRAWIRRRQMRCLPVGYDIDTHFAPRYDPWDQRMCRVPDGDLFQAISDGSLEMVTDRVDEVTEAGLRLASGQELAADIIVTATGLELLMLGGIELAVDGEPVQVRKRLAYKTMMLSGVPNFAYIIGYVNASWTLKSELVCEYVVRVLRHLDKHDYISVTPISHRALGRAPFIPDFTPGYMMRGGAQFPSQGDSKTWRSKLNYLSDMRALRLGRIDNGALQFHGPVKSPAPRNRALDSQGR